MAVLDRERVAVERPHRRARRCGCPRCRTGRRDTGSRSPRSRSSGSGSRPPKCFVRCVVERAVRLHRAAEVRAVVRDDREAWLPVQLAVVANVRSAPGDLARLGVGMKVATTYFPSGKSESGPRSWSFDALLQERRQHHEPERRRGHERRRGRRRARASRTRGTSSAGSARPESRGAAASRRRCVDCGGGRAALSAGPRARGPGPCRRSGRGPRGTRRRARRAPEPGDPPGDDQPDEEDDDADGEADRPEARTRDVRMVVVAARQGSSRDSSGQGRRRSTS